MKDLTKSEIITIGGGKQTPTRIPDWVWGATCGAFTGWYLIQTFKGLFAGATIGAALFSSFSVDTPKLSTSGKKGNLSFSPC